MGPSNKINVGWAPDCEARARRWRDDQGPGFPSLDLTTFEAPCSRQWPSASDYGSSLAPENFRRIAMTNGVKLGPPFKLTEHQCTLAGKGMAAGGSTRQNCARFQRQSQHDRTTAVTKEATGNILKQAFSSHCRGIGPDQRINPATASISCLAEAGLATTGASGHFCLASTAIYRV
jgi:hypothetical protein